MSLISCQLSYNYRLWRNLFCLSINTRLVKTSIKDWARQFCFVKPDGSIGVVKWNCLNCQRCYIIGMIYKKVDMCILLVTLNIWHRFRKSTAIYSSPKQAQVFILYLICESCLNRYFSKFLSQSVYLDS